MVARINTVAFHILLFLIVLIYGGTNLYAENTKEIGCPLFGAEYVPQNPVTSDTYDKNKDHINRTLSFVLRIEKGDMCCQTSERNIFLNFDAYNKDGERVSTMRFGDSWSNGVSRQSFSTYFGMYCNFGKDYESDCEDIKQSAGFVPIGINENFMPASIKQVPYLLIFPGTYWTLRYSSLQVPEHWDKYIRFYTEDRVYPDFRGYDFWVRKKCGDGGME